MCQYSTDTGVLMQYWHRCFLSGTRKDKCVCVKEAAILLRKSYQVQQIPRAQQIVSFQLKISDTYHMFVFATEICNVLVYSQVLTIHFGQVLAHSAHTMELYQYLKQ